MFVAVTFEMLASLPTQPIRPPASCPATTEMLEAVTYEMLASLPTQPISPPPQFPPDDTEMFVAVTFEMLAPLNARPIRPPTSKSPKVLMPVRVMFEKVIGKDDDALPARAATELPPLTIASDIVRFLNSAPEKLSPTNENSAKLLTACEREMLVIE
jgi:hypothetical protein